MMFVLMLEKAFIGTIDLEFIQKKKFFVRLLMMINGCLLKVTTKN